MSKLLNNGTVPQAEKAIRAANSRKLLRLALHDERRCKNRITVIRLLKEALK